MRRVLLLNADYTAIDMLSWQKAMTKLWKDNVYVYKLNPTEFITDSKGRQHPMPWIVVNKKYANKGNKCPYTKLNVYLRDGYTCQYCGQRFHSDRLTIDHVIPRSKFPEGKRGEASVFTNTVTCCQSCNSYKADKVLGVARYPKTITEPWLQSRAGQLIVLRKKPSVPTKSQIFKAKLLHTDIPDEWREFVV